MRLVKNVARVATVASGLLVAMSMASDALWSTGPAVLSESALLASPLELAATSTPTPVILSSIGFLPLLPKDPLPLPTPTETPVPPILPLPAPTPKPEVAFTNSGRGTWWCNESLAWVWYFVEAQNMSERNISGVNFRLSVRNQDNVEISTASASPMVDILRPQEPSPVEFFFSFPPGCRKLRDYQLTKTVLSAAYAGRDTQTGLELLSHESYVDEAGIRHVSGEIRSTASINLLHPRVIVSVIGDEGWNNVIETAVEKPVLSGSLPPQARVSFDVAVGRVEHYGYYKILLEHD